MRSTLSTLFFVGSAVVVGCSQGPENTASISSPIDETDVYLDGDAGCDNEGDNTYWEDLLPQEDAGTVTPSEPAPPPPTEDAGGLTPAPAPETTDDAGAFINPQDVPRPPKPPPPPPKTCPPKIANGLPCTSDKACKSGFCSKENGNKCMACAGVCDTTSIHGQDVVKECIADSGEHKCSSAKHFPCAGTHDNVRFEKCIPAAPNPVVRRGTGVKCQGPAPTIEPRCDGTMTTNCGTGGSETTGVHQNARKICD